MSSGLGGALSRDDASPSPDDVPTSELLRRLAAEPDERLSVDTILARAGGRAYGLALVLFALPEALPLPIAGVSAVIAVPLLMVSAYMILYGAEPRFPAWLRRRSIARSIVVKAVEKGAPYLERAERLTKPRWTRLAGANRSIGFAALILAVVIALPIPLGNILPAICVVALGFGMIQRDGAVVLVALAASAATVAGMTAAAVLAGRLVLDAAGGLFGGA